MTNPVDYKPAARPLSAYVLPSFSQLLFICIFLRLSFGGRRLLDDGDTGWHIRTGEYILRTFSIPKADIFSFITPPPSWIAHEWLSEVIMASIHSLFGLTGIVIFFSLVFASIFYFTFRMMRARKGNILLDLLAVLLVTGSSAIHCLARPHIFSLGFFLAFYAILNAFHYKNVNRLYLLPPLMLLWVNMHGGFIIGFVLVGLYSLSNLVTSYGSPGIEKMTHVRKAKVLALAGTGCLIASLINPNGYHILAFPFTLISTKVFVNNIQEYLSPDFHNINVMAFKLLIYSAIAVFAVSRRKLDFLELILVLLFLHMSLTSVRHIPLFGIIVGPILAAHAAALLDQADGRLALFINKKAAGIEAIDAGNNGPVLPVVAITAVIVSGLLGGLQYNFDDRTKPVAAVDFLGRENIGGNMFNDMQFGDYTIYARPTYKVFIDGRLDMYGTGQFEDYLKVFTISPGWEETLQKYNINWVFIGANSPLSRMLSGKKVWRLIYTDKVADIFVRNSSANLSLIRRYARPEAAHLSEKL